MPRSTAKKPAQTAAPRSRQAPRKSRIADCELRIEEKTRSECEIRNPPGVIASEARPSRSRVRTVRPVQSAIRNPQSAIPNWAYLCFFIVLSLAGILSARYGNPAAGSSPASRGTVPPSRYNTGVVGTPNPVDNTGNAVMTGNVGGGKAFRGNVPYSSTTSFNGRLGTTSLDSFLRNSTVPDEFRDSSFGYTPFYSPTATAARIQPGTGGVFAPGSPRVAAGAALSPRPDQPTDVVTPENLQASLAAGQTPNSYYSYSSASAGALDGLQLSPLAPDEMRRIVAGEPGTATTERLLTPPNQQTMTSEEYQRQVEQLQRDFNRVQTNASQFQQDLRAGQQAPAQSLEAPSSAPLRPMISAEALREMIQPNPSGQDQSTQPSPGLNQNPPITPSGLVPETSVPAGQTQIGDMPSDLSLLPPQSPGTTSGAPGLVLADEVEQQGLSASELTAQKERLAALLAPQGGRLTTPPTGDNPVTRPANQRAEETARTFDTPGRLLAQPLQSSGAEPAQTPPPVPLDQGDSSVSNRPKPVSQPPVPKPAAPDPAAREKFDRLMQLAQADMRLRRYAQAAESFGLACGYNPRDARPQLGRSHAFLAAGEYLNSAACLVKAIELDARTTLTVNRAGLIEILGGPEKFVERITDLENRAKAANSPPGLPLLLAYVYQQMELPQQAKEAIQAARKGMPTSPALDLLEAALRTPK